MIPEQRPPEALSSTLGGQDVCGRPSIRREGHRILVGGIQGLSSIHDS